MQFAKVAPADPNGKFPSQRVPYVVRQKNASFVDKNGNKLPNTEQKPIFLGKIIKILILINMYHLESTINRLRNLRHTLHHLSEDNTVLKNGDLPNHFGDLNLDTFFPNVIMDEMFKSDHEHYDSFYYSFPHDLSEKMNFFVQGFADFNSSAEHIYNKREYWIELSKLAEWKELKEAAKEVLPLIEQYFNDIGILYKKSF